MEASHKEPDSKLARHEHWQQCFEEELNGFEDIGDEGEVWFGEDVQKKTVNYLIENYESKSISILDVGTGNGALLFKLAKKKFDQSKMVGIDYAESSIKLANAIKAKQEMTSITFRFENAFDFIDKEVYDVIHDKGTFDVIVMNPDLSNTDYAKAMRYRLKTGGIFLITSCNMTSAELDGVFLGDGIGFKLKEEIKGYR